MKHNTNFKRLLSGVLSAVMAFSAVPVVSVHAEESTEPYPYTIFAASSDEGAITVNAGNFCVNGNVATNGTIVSSGNMNVNGTRTENADDEMIHILKKLNYSYFSGDNVEVYVEDYSFNDLNININNPMDVYGSLELTGNINLNSGIKAYEDVTINGEVKNTHEAVICSETGDIIIESTNINFNGLIYAPCGDIIIETGNLNLNNVVIIGQTITFDCPNVNANYSRNTAELVGTESDIDIELYAMGEYNSEANSIDIRWYTNYANSSYEIWISDDNENYNSISAVSDVTTYQYLITENFEKRYFKISFTTNYGEIESIPFVVAKAEEGYSVDFLDSDDDRMADVFEVMIGTDVNNPDTDDDGLTDYQEAYITGTDPTKYDSVTEGVSDADADSDGDGLSNAQEIELGTDPRLSDTDDDNLSDYDELYVYGTDPIKPDTDFDGLSDADEVALGTNPNLPDTDGDGIPDGEEKFEQTYVYAVENEDCAVEQVIVSMEGTGNLQSTMSVNSIMNKDVICSDVVGLVGEPFSIETTSDFETATLSFKIDQTKLGDTDFNDLLFLWYDEDNYQFVELDTNYDETNSLVSIQTTHFSRYMVVDKFQWYEVKLSIKLDTFITNKNQAARIVLS